MLFFHIVRIIKTSLCSCLSLITLSIREYYFDKKHGLEYLFGPRLPAADTGLHRDSAGHEATVYANLERIFDYLDMGEEDVFVDIGCGKGRTVCFVALRNVKKVIGIELERRYVETARRNVERLRPRPRMPVRIYHADAATFKIREGTVFYMFNPFGLLTLKSVMENIRQSVAADPRPVRIVYFNPVHGWFLDAVDWLVKEGELRDTAFAAIAVWRNRQEFCHPDPRPVPEQLFRYRPQLLS